MRKLLGFFSFLVLAAPLAAQTLPDHSTFDRALEGVVHGSLVDYAGLQSTRGDLDAYVEELSRTDAQALASASREAVLAFWINAYNACALKLVIDHYPIKKASFPSSLVKTLAGVPANSIRQIADTWKREFCPVAGKDRALDEIEHEIIRPMGEPRIHFAVNCASRSCPVLAPTAYKAETLDNDLDQAVQRFIGDATQYRLERGDPPVFRVNKILDWYGDDFGGREGVIEFLAAHAPDDDKTFLRNARAPRLEFSDYDWTLNDTAVFASGH